MLAATAFTLLLGQTPIDSEPAASAVAEQHVFLNADLPLSGPYAKYADWVQRDFPGAITQNLSRQGFRLAASASGCVHCLWLSARVDFTGPDWKKKAHATLTATNKKTVLATCTADTDSFDTWAVAAELARCVGASRDVLAYAGEPQVDPAPTAAAPASPAPAARTLALAKAAKMVVLPLRALNKLAPDVAKLMTSLLLSELDRVAGLRTVSQSDIEAMLGVEKQKEMLGCSSTSCIAEIGGALGADYVLHGEVGTIGSKHTLNLTVIQSAKNAVTTRVSRLAENEEALATALPAVVASIVEALNKPK
jgi:hypothetical protein